MFVWSIAIKVETKNVMFWSQNDSSKVKNTLLQWILQNVLEIQTFQRIAKFIMVNSYKMDFTKGNVILVKVDEMYNILKSVGHSSFVERWRWNWMIRFFAEVCLECLYAYYAPPLLRSRLHLGRDTAAEKEFDICNICITRWHCYEHVSAEIQENKKGRKN